MCYDNDHTDAEIARREHAAEMGESSPTEKRWLRWCADVEKLIGQDLDGNDEIDCHSIDFGYEAFQRNETPLAYAKGVQRRREALAAELRRGGQRSPFYRSGQRHSDTGGWGWRAKDVAGYDHPICDADLGNAIYRLKNPAE